MSKVEKEVKPENKELPIFSDPNFDEFWYSGTLAKILKVTHTELKCLYINVLIIKCSRIPKLEKFAKRPNSTYSTIVVKNWVQKKSAIPYFQAFADKPDF